MKKIYAILIALLFVGFTAAAFAAPPDAGNPGIQKHPGFHAFGPRLNLTQDQIGKMKELGKNFWADTHDLRYDIKMKRVEVRKLFTDPKTDEATLLAKEKELNGLKLKLMDKKAEMKVEWRKILTPDQIRIVDRILSHHGWRGHHCWHHRGGMGKGFWRHHHHDPMGKGLQQAPGATTGR